MNKLCRISTIASITILALCYQNCGSFESFNKNGASLSSTLNSEEEVISENNENTPSNTEEIITSVNQMEQISNDSTKEAAPRPDNEEEQELTEDVIKMPMDNNNADKDVFSINNPLDKNDPRYISQSAPTQMSFGPCPGQLPPSGEDCVSHKVERPPLGNGMSGGTTNWSLDEIEGDEVFLSWWQKFNNRDKVGQPTKLYGLAAKKTVGYPAFNPASQTKTQWLAKYSSGIGGQAGGSAGWYHGGGGVNGLGQAWSARMIHSGGFGFTNTGQISIETYHTDSTNLLIQREATRQFGENIQPFTKKRRIGIDRIIDSDWHHYCMRVKLNSLSQNPHKSINRDGILQLFVDKNLVVNRTNIHFTEDPAYRKFRAYMVIFGGGNTVNTQDWQTYTSGIRYSPTGCIYEKK